MKIKKQDLRENIEQIIGEGVINGEEIDVTTEKVLKLVWGLIEHLQMQGTNNGDLEDVAGRSEQLVCDKCGYPMFYHKPDDIMYCHGCDNTKQAN